MVIRKSVCLANVPEQQILPGSTNNNMLFSEDLEMLSYIQKSTYEIWYNPAMEIYHKIPKHRLNKDCLISFLKNIGYSRYITRMIGVKFWQKPFMFVLYLLNDLRKIITHLLKYGFAVQSDLIAMCELT
ncbi:MAG TPA: hypothetical protein V6C58_00815 [Allocoleopsis sp.]